MTDICDLAPVLVTPASEYPVTLEQAKKHLRLSDNDDDFMVELLVSSATAWAEKKTGRAFVDQTWRSYFSAFDTKLRLPRRPVQSIESVSYYDSDDIETTILSSNYSLYQDGRGYYVSALSSYTWPTPSERSDAVAIEFVAGYGTPDNVPAPIKHAILVMVSQMYPLAREDVFLRREEVPGLGSREYIVSDVAEGLMSRAADSLLRFYVVPRL